MTVTATPNLETGQVSITITDKAQVQGIIRADDNGTHPVRLAPGQLPRTGPLTLVDHEAALSGQVQYRVTLAGQVETLDAWTTLAGAGPLLPRFILPSNPRYSVVVETVTNYAAARRSSSTVHEVIGRPDPVLALGQLRPRTGRLEVFTRTYQEARTLEALLERGQVTMYRQAENPGQDMYLVALDLDTQPSEGLAWLTTINYQEVLYPAGAVLSRPDWTFEALAEEYGTFDQVAVTFANFPQLAIGEAGQ